MLRPCISPILASGGIRANRRSMELTRTSTQWIDCKQSFLYQQRLFLYISPTCYPKLPMFLPFYSLHPGTSQGGPFPSRPCSWCLPFMGIPSRESQSSFPRSLGGKLLAADPPLSQLFQASSSPSSIPRPSETHSVVEFTTQSRQHFHLW